MKISKDSRIRPERFDEDLRDFQKSKKKTTVFKFHPVCIYHSFERISEDFRTKTESYKFCPWQLYTSQYILRDREAVSFLTTLRGVEQATYAGCCLRTLRRSRNLLRNFSALSLASGASG